jgi:hypothetical protein
LWQVKGEKKKGKTNHEMVWRASLDSPQTGDRVGFKNLELLFDYIRKKTGRMLEKQDNNLNEESE